jgi:hypothetical protein
MATTRLPNGIVLRQEPTERGTSWRAFGPGGEDVGTWVGHRESRYAWVRGQRLSIAKFRWWLYELRQLEFGGVG